MKKILLPTDFSQQAWSAVCFTLEMLADEPAELYLLHTYVPAFYRVDYALGGPAASGIQDAMLMAAISGLEHTAKKIEEHFPGHPHKVHQTYAFSLLTDEVVEICRREKIDLVVMGTKGATGAARILFGSNAVFVMRKSPVPVLLIPDQYRFKKWEAVLFPTDYLRRYKSSDFEILRELLKGSGAVLDVVHVEEGAPLSERQLENREKFKKSLKGLNPVCHEIHEGVMPTAITELMGSGRYSLLVMMNRKHTYLERLLLRQNVESFGFEVSIPFLMIPSQAELNV